MIKKKKKLIYILVIMSFVVIYVSLDSILAALQIENSINKDISTIESELNVWLKYNPFYGKSFLHNGYYKMKAISFIGIVSLGFIDSKHDYSSESSEGDGKIDFCWYEIIPWSNWLTRYFGVNILVYRFNRLERSSFPSLFDLTDYKNNSYEPNNFYILIFRKIDDKNHLVHVL